MLAFNNDPQLKVGLLAEVHQHYEQDQIIKGTYGRENGVWKGCAVGCSIRSYNRLLGCNYATDDHTVYEKFGIPEWLARVEDAIFEGLPEDRAKCWPEQFLAAIRPGANLDTVKTPFVLFVLRSLFANFDHQQFPDVKSVLDTVIHLYEADEQDEAAWSAARSAAWSAARSAAESARSAAWGKFADKLTELLRAA